MWPPDLDLEGIVDKLVMDWGVFVWLREKSKKPNLGIW